MSEYTRNDKFWNDYIWEKVGVIPIDEKIGKIRLWQFEYVQRRLLETSIKILDQMIFNLMKISKGKKSFG